MADVLGGSMHAMGVTFSMIGMGAVLRQQGIVSPAGQREMSQVAVKLLLPAFNFSALVMEVTWDKLLACKGVAVWSVVHMMLGLAAGWVLTKTFRGSPFLRDHWGQTMVLCGFCNGTAMPLTLFRALVGSQPHVKAMESQGSLDITIYGTVWRLLLWTVGIAILEAEAGSGKSAKGKNTSLGRLVKAALWNTNTFAALAGLFVALGPPALREVLIGGKLSFMREGIANIAKGSHTMLLLTLGAALWPIPAVKDWKAVFGVCFAKLVALPLMTLALLHGGLGMGAGLGLGTSGLLVVAIESCVPSAMQVSMMVQSTGMDARACTVIVFWQHIVALVTMTFFVALSLLWTQ